MLRRVTESTRHPTFALAAGLAAATVLLRLPFLTARLAHWDAVNYALGLHDFDVAAHQPHPPGSPYFILLGRAVLALVGDDNAALTAISVGASALGVVAEYVLVSRLFGNRAALLAALALTTHPIFWGYGTMASAWTLLALLSIGIAALCARQRLNEATLVMAIASGFRLDATVLVAPLWLWTLVRSRRSVLPHAAFVAAGILVWLVPVVVTSGGPTAWLDRSLALFAPSGDRLRQFISNTAITAIILALSIGPAIVLNWRSALRTTAMPFLLLWTLPAVLVLWLVDSTEAGHALVLMGALCACSAALLSRSRHPWLYTAIVVLVQTTLFLTAAPRWDKPPPWAPNAALLNVTAPGIQRQQASLAASIQAVQRFEPADTVVLTVKGQNAYRFMMYYVPAYAVLDVDPIMHTVLEAREREQGHWREWSDCPFDASTVRHALLVVWTTSEPGLVPEDATPIAGGGDGPFQIWELDPANQYACR